MGLTVYGGGGKPEEEKTVTAGTSVIEVNPSSGKVMKKVTVNPTPTESKSVTPSTSELTVTPSAGKHLSQVVVGAVEDVTPEVTAQTPVITHILEGLVGKAQGANATADKILEGYSAYVGQELINGTATKSGAYVWKKLTAQGGDFVDFVTDDLETKYPDGGTQDGYWYEKVVEGISVEDLGFSKYSIGSFVSTEKVLSGNFTIEHNLGEVPKIFIIILTGGSFVANYTNKSYLLDYIYNSMSVSLITGYSVMSTMYNKSGKCHFVGSTAISITNTTFSFTTELDSTLRLPTGAEYKWIALA